MTRRLKTSPKGSSRAQLLEAKENLQHMLASIPLTEDERAAVDDAGQSLERAEGVAAETRVTWWCHPLQVRRIAPRHGYVDLNVHRVWALLQVRPDLLRSGAAARALRDRLPIILDGRELSARGRRELEGQALAEAVLETGSLDWLRAALRETP